MSPRYDLEKIEDALVEMTNKITISNEVRIKIDNIQLDFARHDERLRVLERSFIDAKEYQLWSRAKFDELSEKINSFGKEMTGLAVKVGGIIATATIFGPPLIGFLIRNFR